MNPVFKKLNFKAQKSILVINAPESFRPAMEEMKPFTEVQTDINKVPAVEFVLAFVTKQSEIDQLAPKINEVLKGDGVLYFAYPKGTSKRYKCDFNRDTGWDTLGKLGFEGVRMVAIDENWSALRFRRAEFIKNMVREKVRAMSETGQEKLKKK